MITRSTVIAIAAIVLSLLVHFIGLNLAREVRRQPIDDGAGPQDVVAVGNSFEDIAEERAALVPPEPAAVPDPAEQPTPPPESAEIPTSQALVASPDPQQTLSPDTGDAAESQPELTAPVAPEQGQSPDPQTTEPTGAEAEQPATEATAETPVENVPEQTPEQTAAQAPEPAVEPVAPPATSAAITPAPAPAPAPVPLASAVPLVPLPPSTAPLDPVQEPITPEPDTPQDADTPAAVSDLAVTTSLRPQRPPERSPAATVKPSNGLPDLSALKSPPRLESPLSSYQRNRTDLFVPQSGGSLTAADGFPAARGGGNSSVTNYEGRVLVHLNRIPTQGASLPGVAQVVFGIRPDGSLNGIEILSNTGPKELARAAITQIQRAAPFPPPPNGQSYKLSFVYRGN